MAQDGLIVLHYHTKNGRFYDNGFVETINSKDQNITFYGVGAHHQNGTVQRKTSYEQSAQAAPTQYKNVAVND